MRRRKRSCLLIARRLRSIRKFDYEEWRCNDRNWIRTVRNRSRSDEVKKKPLYSSPLRINFVIADSYISIVNADIYMKFREAVDSLCSSLTHEDVASMTPLRAIANARTQDSYHMRLIRAAPTIAPQTAADATLIRTTAARKAKQSSSPSSSKYARATSAITVAGAILLNGTGVRSNAAVRNRITTPTKCLAASKAVGQRG